jgi:hypothetical protein
VADKLTALTLAALGKVATSPAGMSLYGTRSAPGLFPNTAAGKAAARRAIDTGLLTPNRFAPAGKETYSPTESGLQFLLDQSNPKAVLEDFVRGVEARRTQVDDLLATAHAMSDELTALRATVAAVLPTVVQTRTTVDSSDPPSPYRGGAAGGIAEMTRTKPRASTATAILARLADWTSTAGAGQDCPLPDLYRSLTVCDDLTVGRFHDELRTLHAAHSLYLHPWTGPLYALPEPTFALLIGHEVAYYASLSGQWSVVSSQNASVSSGH